MEQLKYFEMVIQIQLSRKNSSKINLVFAKCFKNDRIAFSCLTFNFKFFLRFKSQISRFISVQQFATFFKLLIGLHTIFRLFVECPALCNSRC